MLRLDMNSATKLTSSSGIRYSVFGIRYSVFGTDLDKKELPDLQTLAQV